MNDDSDQAKKREGEGGLATCVCENMLVPTWFCFAERDRKDVLVELSTSLSEWHSHCPPFSVAQTSEHSFLTLFFDCCFSFLFVSLVVSADVPTRLTLCLPTYLPICLSQHTFDLESVLLHH